MKIIFRIILMLALFLIAYPMMAQENQLTKKELDKRKSKLELESATKLLTKVSKDSYTPEMLNKLFITGENLKNKGVMPEAEVYFSLYMELLADHLKLRFSVLGTQNREMYWQKYSDRIKYIQHVAINHCNKHVWFGELAYNCELLSKSLLLNSSTRVQKSMMNSDDSEIRTLWQELKSISLLFEEYKTYINLLDSDSTYIAAKKAISEGKQHEQNKELKQLDEMQRYMTNIEKKVLEWEESIGLLTHIYSPNQPDFTTTWKKIRDKLHQTQASIEFVAHSRDGKDSNLFYSALLILPKSDYPKVIPLTDNTTLEEALKAFDFDSLYQLIWLPIEKQLTNVTEIYISTSGLLNTVPFATLKQDQNYLTDTYFVHNVLSTKEILDFKKTEVTSLAGNALFLGGADFNASLNELSDNEEKHTNPNPTNLTRSQLDELNPTRGQGFDYLPGSKIEVKKAHQIVTNHQWHATVLTDKLASEGRLKAFTSAHSPTLLHLSTHGFYFNKSNKKDLDLKIDEAGSMESAAFRFSENPLMRSGLLLAGANQVWSGKEPIDGLDDGIVTALELSSLNLSETGLVVVSGCKTGLGDIDYSEGVYGIQRALRLAGAKSIIVSLWNIPDNETVEFMEAFYKSLTLRNDLSVAFREAQAYMRQHYPTDPKIWAGFVLIE